MSRTVSAHRSSPPPLATPIEDHLRRRLELLAARTGWTPAELITEAIDEYLERRDRARLPSWVGAGGRPNEARIGEPT